MSETFVLSFEHLKGRPKADQALPLLQRIASLVKPIMRKHSWKLPVLAEFFPDSPNLIGMWYMSYAASERLIDGYFLGLSEFATTPMFMHPLLTLG